MLTKLSVLTASYSKLKIFETKGLVKLRTLYIRGTPIRSLAV